MTPPGVMTTRAHGRALGPGEEPQEIKGEAGESAREPQGRGKQETKKEGPRGHQKLLAQRVPPFPLNPGQH